MSNNERDEVEVINFIKEAILGWISNLMRDLDAQGYAVSLEEVGTALDVVLDEVADMDSVSEHDLDDFLRELDDRRDRE